MNSDNAVSCHRNVIQRSDRPDSRLRSQSTREFRRKCSGSRINRSPVFVTFDRSGSQIRIFIIPRQRNRSRVIHIKKRHHLPLFNPDRIQPRGKRILRMFLCILHPYFPPQVFPDIHSCKPPDIFFKAAGGIQRRGKCKHQYIAVLLKRP